MGPYYPPAQGPPSKTGPDPPASEIWWRPIQTYSLKDTPHTNAEIWWLTTEAQIVGEWAIDILMDCFLVTKYIEVCKESRTSVRLSFLL